MAIVAAAVCLVALLLLLGRTNIGLHMRAASMDFQTARMLGVDANRVIGAAVLVSGLLAGVVGGDADRADAARHAGLRAARHDRRARGSGARRHEPAASATLGGFAIGFVSGVLGGALPTDQSQYLPSFLFGAVILVLLVRPGGLFARGRDAAVQRV